jgi:hypothetical protein
MKYIITALLALTLSACGGGGSTQGQELPVELAPDTKPPSPFIIGPSTSQPSGLPDKPVVTFTDKPVEGPTAIIQQPIISTQPTVSVPNWCTDGFVIGPCEQRCKPNEFVIGPC